MISAVDLLNGIARCAGMDIIQVPGATGYLDTDYHAKARYAIEALKDLDFLYLHVEAPDEAGHLGSVEEKVKAIERVDEMLGIIMEEFSGVIAILPDHPTPVRLKTHTRDSVPFAVRGLKKDNGTGNILNGRPGQAFMARSMPPISFHSCFPDLKVLMASGPCIITNQWG